MKIFEKVNAHTNRVRSSSLTGITVSAGAPAGAFGVSYMVNQNASQTSPARPTNANADCQPVRRIRYATIGGARIAPTADPLLNSPAASARSLSGDHSPTTFTAPAPFPAPRLPSVDLRGGQPAFALRDPLRHHLHRARPIPCLAHAQQEPERAETQRAARARVQRRRDARSEARRLGKAHV